MEILNKDIILVTGSTGFLGSHLLKELKRMQLDAYKKIGK
jgi:nucleoside-diphosphate-sugar epimerase